MRRRRTFEATSDGHGPKAASTGAGMGLGVALGTALGVAFGNIAMGIAIGVALGLVFVWVMAAGRNDEPSS